MIIQSIPDLIKDVLTVTIQKGETVRIVHEYQRDGTACSIDKDPCLNITRVQSGFKYFCHRCHEQGYVPLSRLTPEETVNLVARIRFPKDEVEYAEEEELRLPDDSIPVITMTRTDGEWEADWNSEIPFIAKQWLWGYGLHDAEPIASYDIVWSDKYHRLIFPIYNEDKELEGWVGRNVDGEKPKWLTRKSTALEDRLLFIADVNRTEIKKIIWVEDAISAIKVNKATGHPTIALLTTTLSYEVASLFKEYEQLLWLDGDMKSKMLKTVLKLQQYGIKIRMKYTTLDPKEYTLDEIKQYTGDWREP